METINTKKEIEYISLIRALAAVFVLILHTNGCFWDFSSTERYWKTANIIECVFYPAVPLFFMISGITLMDFMDRTNLREYFKKRINKVVVPFVAWSLIGVVEKIAIHWINKDDVNIKFIYQGVTGTNIISIFWFFTTLFCIYLSMPLFSAVEKSKRELIFTYLVVTGFVLNYLFPFINRVFAYELNTPYTVIVVSGSLIWIPLGWLLHKSEMSRKCKMVVYLFAFFGLLMHIIGTQVLSIQAGEIVKTFKGYENVPCILYSVGVFVFLKDMGNKVMNYKKFSIFVKWFDKYTFSIYLMQFIFLDTFPMLPFVHTKTLTYRLGAPFVIIPIIIGITWLMRKIPVLKKIVP